MASKAVTFETLEQQLFCVRFAEADLLEAKQCLIKANTELDMAVKSALVRAALVAYARPFLICKMPNKSKQPLITNRCVPKELRELHKEVIAYRNSYVAHSDLYLRNPRLFSFEGMGQTNFAMAFRHSNIERWVNSIELLQSFVDSVFTITNEKSLRINESLSTILKKR